MGGEKEKPKMAYPFLASVTSDFESKIIYIFSKNINLEYGGVISSYLRIRSMQVKSSSIKRNIKQRMQCEDSKQKCDMIRYVFESAL